MKQAQAQMLNTLKGFLCEDGSQGLEKLLILTKNSFRQLMQSLTAEI